MQPSSNQWPEGVDPSKSVVLKTGDVWVITDIYNLRNKARWTLKNKEAVIKAIAKGMITEQLAITWFALTHEEIDDWRFNFKDRGLEGLKQTRLGSRTKRI